MSECGIIQPFRYRNMRPLLVAAAVAGISLTAMLPVQAKSAWLDCGIQVINLDSVRERFSLTTGGKVYQGAAMFSPAQINFEYQWAFLPGGDGHKWAYTINRKTLEYTLIGLARTNLLSADWRETVRKTGKCSIMKTPPTAGNQI